MNLKIMVIVSAKQVTGPVKGIFQLLDYFKGKNITFFLYNIINYSDNPIELVKEANQKNFVFCTLSLKNKNY